MLGTQGAIRLIELVSAGLCDAMEQSGDGGSLPAVALRRAAWCAPKDASVGEAIRAEAITLDRLMALASGLPKRTALDASPLAANTAFRPLEGRIVCNLLLLGAESLPSGGVITLAGGTGDLFLQIAGQVTRWPSGLALWFNDETAAEQALYEAASMQGALTALLAREARLRLSLLIPPAGQNVPPMLRLGG